MGKNAKRKKNWGVEAGTTAWENGEPYIQEARNE